MYNNPIFQYGGINNAGGAAPYNISLVNTGTTEERVNLFNAQENLTAENQGLPEKVIANASDIFEMPTSQLFSCFQNAPLLGFRDETNFALRNSIGKDVRSFQLNQNVITNTAKIFGGGYSGVQNPPFYKIDGGRQNVEANAEGLGSVLRFIFSVTSTSQLQGGLPITDVVVRNSTTFPCTDIFPLTQTQTGFNPSESSALGTYSEILQQTNFSPFGVESIVIQSSQIQGIVTNPVTLTETNANGNRDSQEISLLRSPYMNATQRVLNNIGRIDGATELSFTMPPNSQASLFIYDKYRMEL